ncbi:hypothetical protein [Aureliella helgolandensis]|uniref:Uncharacterized protein n=1 Tax=Aureliella helgolandensis TaxID=2527968 RepID=A0A518FZP4_9BACT|nr:hypothetical protein [Aureliella helgolandensis]QDV21760.1 hypothetical protein Q31a_00390 [Aureliella helgolandensis]
MANQSNREGEPLQIDGGSLGNLVFEWANDRYHHFWSFSDAPTTPILASVESNSSSVWPTSPPLQQIHQQNFVDGRQIVFGVGMSGRGHWSASFTLIPDLKCWIVELACRSPIQPERLLSTYQVAEGWNQSASGAISGAIGNHAIHVEAISPSSIAELVDTEATFAPKHPASGAATSQWAFRLRAN